ncbi:TPA: cellulase family glycosylhydrolase [Serratia marcescens]
MFWDVSPYSFFEEKFMSGLFIREVMLKYSPSAEGKNIGRYANKVKALAVAGLLLLGTYQNANAFEVGVNVHLRHYPKPTDNYLTLIKDYGFTSFRAGYLWGMVERTAGEFKVVGPLIKEDDAFQQGVSKYGLNSLLILAYGNAAYNSPDYPTTPEAIDGFANYAYWTAKRFKGKVKYYEIWNEWTVGTGLKKKKAVPPPDVFAALVKKTSAAIKRADPDAVVMAGSLNPLGQRGIDWFDSLMKLGILNDIDAISLHPYSYRNENMALRNPEDNLAAIDKFESRVKAFSKRTVPLYITEMGVPTYNGPGGLSNSAAAQYIVKYTMMAKARSYIKGVWWYDLIDDGDNPKINEHRFGLLNRQEKPKPSAIAYEKIAKVVRDYSVSDYKETANGVVSIALKGEGNQYAMLYWQKSKTPKDSDQPGALKSLMSSVTGGPAQQPDVKPLAELTNQAAVLQGDTPVLLLSDKPIVAPTH